MYLLWPRTPVAVLPDIPDTTTTTVVTAAPTTTRPKVVPVVDEETDTGPPAASEVEGSIVTTAESADTDTTTVTTRPDTGTVTTRPDTGTTTVTTAAPVVSVGEPPTFGVITPTHVWPENPGVAIGNPARRAVLVWDSVRAFWEWYLVEGHPQAHGFDAATRPELSETAAEQINWVHNRFWSEILPRWDRVWNDEFAKEREQQREWLMMAYNGNYVYNRPDDGFHARYWGPTECVPIPNDPDGACLPTLLPLVDLDRVKQWMAERGYDLDMAVDLYGHGGLFDADTLADVLTQDQYAATGGDAEYPAVSTPLLDPAADIWQEWAASGDLVGMLGPQAAGGKMGPADGEMWYQWYPEGFDVTPLYPDDLPVGDYPGGTNFADIFEWHPDWWPERLEIPVHDPAQAGVAGTIAPQNPDTGNYYFEACLWASGGLFGPWSLPHPELPEASANTTWWITGLADPSGTIVEISRPPQPSLPAGSGPLVLRKGMVQNLGRNTARRHERVYRLPCLRPTPEHMETGVARHAGQQRPGFVDVAGKPQPEQPTSRIVGLGPAPSLHRSARNARCDDPPPLHMETRRCTGRLPGRRQAFPVEMVACGTRPRRPRTAHQLADLDRWMPPARRAVPVDGITHHSHSWYHHRRWPRVGMARGHRRQLPAGYRQAMAKRSQFRLQSRTYTSNPWHPQLVGVSHLIDSEYHPPVPCQDIYDSKYEPDAVDYAVTFETYETWMPAVGDKPPTGWTDPHDPFTN